MQIELKVNLKTFMDYERDTGKNALTNLENAQLEDLVKLIYYAARKSLNGMSFDDFVENLSGPEFQEISKEFTTLVQGFFSPDTKTKVEKE